MSATEAFRVIGIPPTDDWKAILAKHKEAVREVHPDSNPASKGRAAHVLHLETTGLNEARDVLKSYREQGRSLVDEVRIEAESAEESVEETSEEEDPFDFVDEVPEPCVGAEKVREWPPPGSGQPVRSTRWRKPIFWIGLALGSLFSWASTVPELAPDADDRMAARFWALVGMSLVLGATMSRLRSGLRARLRRSRSPVRKVPVALVTLAVGVLVPVGGVAVYRSLSEQTAGSGGTSLPVGDPCVVGTWGGSHLVSDGEVALRGGAGTVLTIEASGRSHTDFSRASSLEGIADGSTFVLNYQGHYTAQLRATRGRLRETEVDYSHLTLMVTRDGREEATSPISESATRRYSCSSTTLTIDQDVYSRQAA